VSPKIFGGLAASVGTVLAVLWGAVGGNTSLIATLAGLIIVGIAGALLDDEG
jgi:hypothetical protein